MQKRNVLIVGGYGEVGRQIAQILLDRHEDLDIVLGGRSPGKAAALESERVHTVVVDTNTEDPLQHVDEPISLIISAVNDLQDKLLLAAVKRKIPFIDVTRWTELFEQASAKLKKVKLHAPVVLSSGWMAGTASLFAKLYAESLQNVAVDIHALYSLQDKAGPDSTAYMDRLTIPFHITEAGKSRLVHPMTDPVKVQFPNGYEAKCYRLDTPDHMTLLKDNHIDTASFRISFDSKTSTSLLVALVNSGLWKMISGKRFRSFRQRLLYNPGTGSTHHVLIHLKGTGPNGRPVERRVAISDPLGQTHLTALGAAVQAEKLLLMPNNEPIAPGVYYPEDLPNSRMDKAAILNFFKQYGVVVSN
ncbi:saccharopine dehydrogenase NADP-binding domain-containing protein [Paenibacillus sp. KS-LC4]|uniref:saccharopine dehydrogenase NADP-binding domain-containing protein n=1 Tax=Paenibacillus sp. KS-LC4 TaxID=2979727 RepID=UPI0030CCEF74